MQPSCASRQRQRAADAAGGTGDDGNGAGERAHG
jgi:hypothetical protein